MSKRYKNHPDEGLIIIDSESDWEGGIEFDDTILERLNEQDEEIKKLKEELTRLQEVLDAEDLRPDC